VGLAIVRLSYIPFKGGISRDCFQVMDGLRAYARTSLTPQNSDPNGFDQEELREPACFGMLVEALQRLAMFSDFPADTASLIQSVLQAMMPTVVAEVVPTPITDEVEDRLYYLF
jgi:hypothetical protein